MQILNLSAGLSCSGNGKRVKNQTNVASFFRKTIKLTCSTDRSGATMTREVQLEDEDVRSAQPKRFSCSSCPFETDWSTALAGHKKVCTALESGNSSVSSILLSMILPGKKTTGEVRVSENEIAWNIN